MPAPPIPERELQALVGRISAKVEEMERANAWWRGHTQQWERLRATQGSRTEVVMAPSVTELLGDPRAWLAPWQDHDSDYKRWHPADGMLDEDLLR